MRINLTTPMSDDKEMQRRNAAVLDAIERHTEERMNDEYGRIHKDGSRSGGHPTQHDCEVAASIRSALYRACSNMPNYPVGIVEPFLAAHHQHGYDQGYYDGSTRQPAQSDVNERLGAWLSAALDDPNCSDAFKQDINDWFANQPTQSDALREEIERLRQPKTVTFTVVSAADGNPMHTFKIDPTKKTTLRPLHSMIGYVFEPEGSHADD
jgi:hypothetical protein